MRTQNNMTYMPYHQKHILSGAFVDFGEILLELELSFFRKKKLKANGYSQGKQLYKFSTFCLSFQLR